MEKTIEKARVLMEALPYIREYQGARVVIKYGGNAMADGDEAASFASDIALMQLVGIRPVVVHGGGPQISATLKRLGIESRFVGGLRVTDAATMEVVKMVLVGQINKEIVSLVNRHGDLAVGLSGDDANLLVARRIAGPQGEDLGFVGEVEQVKTGVLEGLLDRGYVPILASVARGRDGASYNVNADTVAGAVAVALGAAKLVYLTNVAGLYEDFEEKGSLLSQVDAGRLGALRSSGKLSEGMVPKVTSCVRAVEGGVPRAHILDGRVEHALLLEIFTDEGIGTMVTP
ncbi:MAG: acetylglutamate kinase [Actinomycetota bacterium]|jgi:acetylglutamate kinase